MIYLALAVFLGVCIYWIFKFAGMRELDLFSVIMLNYPVCVFMGAMHLLGTEELSQLNTEALLWSAGLGLLFITMFNLMAVLTKKEGVATSSVVSRLSMVLPTLFFFVLHDHAMSLFNWLGLALAMGAVFLLNAGASGSGQRLLGWLPLVVFLGYGAVDIVLKLAELRLGSAKGNFHLMSMGTFFFAGVYGLLYKGFKGIRTDKKHVTVGVVLGGINYYSIVFFLWALNTTSISPAVIFPLNGILILTIATVGSIFLFKESVSKQKLLALGLAVAAIVLLSHNGNF